MVMDEKHGDGHSTFLLEVGTTPLFVCPFICLLQEGWELLYYRGWELIII